MAETLFNQFADEGALAAERDRILTQILQPIKDAVKSLNFKVGDIDSSQSKRSVDELSKTVDALQKKLSETQTEIAALTSKLNEYAKATTQAANAQSTATQATTGSANAIKSETQALQENAAVKQEAASAEVKSARAAVDSAKAKKDAADADLKSAEAAFRASKAKDEVTAAEIKNLKAIEEGARAKQLSTAADLQAAQAALKAASSKEVISAAEVKSAKAAVAAARAKKDGADADLKAAKASLAAAKSKDTVAVSDIKSAKAALDGAKAKKDGAEADLRGATAALTAANAKKTLADEAQKAAVAQAKEEKIIDQAIDDYYNLSKAYEDAARRAQNLQIRLGESHPVAQQATKDALELANTLKRLDASVGKNQRSVGDYKSAVRGLGFSFTQVARELPSLTVSVQQFALAISNNLPFVADSLRDTTREIARLKAEGKAVPSLFSAISKSIFSWQVGLAVAITIFTAFIGKLFSGKTAAEKFDVSLHALTITTEQLSKKIEALGQEMEFLNQLGDIVIKINFEGDFERDILSLQTRMVGLLEEATTIDKSLDVAIAAADKTFKRTLDNISQEAHQVIALFGQIKDIPAELISSLPDKDQKFLNAVKKQEEGIADLAQKGIENERKRRLIAAEIRLKQIEEERKKEQDIFDKFFAAELELQRDQLLKKAENENVFIKDRIDSRKKAAELDKQIVLGNAAAEIREVQRSALEQGRNASETAKEINFIRKTAAVDIKRIVIKSGEDILKIEQQWSDKIFAVYNKLVEDVKNKFAQLIAAKESIAEDLAENSEIRFEQDTTDIEKFYDEQQSFLEASLKRGMLTREQFAAAEKKLAEDKNKALLDTELTRAQELLTIEKQRPNADPKKIEELEKEILAIKAKYRDIDFKNFEELLSKIEDATAASMQRQKEMWQGLQDEILSAFTEIGSGIYDKQLNAIKDQIEAIDQLKAAEVERINSSTDTEEKKAARIIIIEARAQNQREALGRRQREIKKKQAIFEKAAKVFEITIEGIRTMQAVQQGIIKAKALLSAAIASFNPVLIAAATAGVTSASSLVPITIASTAAQIAAVVGTPVPSYAKGTQSSPEGIAEVAEKGPELAVDKKGKAKLYEKHTLTYLTKGTKIYPADATKAILNAAEKERSGILRAFNQNVTISAPSEQNGEELKKQTKILERLESKSRIVIMNNSPIETEAWYQKHFKF